MQNADQPYLFTEFQPAHTLVRTREAELSGPRILLHSVLLFITGICTTLTGAAFAVQPHVQDDSSSIELLFAPIIAVITETASGNLEPLTKGLLFSFTLLTILARMNLGTTSRAGITASEPRFRISFRPRRRSHRLGRLEP